MHPSVGSSGKKRNQQEIQNQRDFPGSPVVKTLNFHGRGRGSMPGWGIKIPCTSWCKERKKVGHVEQHRMESGGTPALAGQRGLVSEGPDGECTAAVAPFLQASVFSSVTWGEGCRPLGACEDQHGQM